VESAKEKCMDISSQDFKQKITTLGFFLWSLGGIFYSYEFLLRTSMNAISQDMIHSLHLSATSISIIGSSFYWCYVAVQIPAGVLADKYGPKKILTLTTFICVVGTIVFILSDSFYIFCLGRALMGASGGFAFACTLKIASYRLPDRLFPLFAGFTQFLGYIGAALSGSPFVALMQHYHWNTIFIFIAAFGG
jgi:MFS family permease